MTCRFGCRTGVCRLSESGLLSGEVACQVEPLEPPSEGRALLCRSRWRDDGYITIPWDSLDHWFEEDEEVFVHPRDPFVRIDALQSSRHVRVERDGRPLAESDSPILLFETGLPTRYYLPERDVDPSLLAEQRSGHRLLAGQDHRHRGAVLAARLPRLHGLQQLLVGPAHQRRRVRRGRHGRRRQLGQSLAGQDRRERDRRGRQLQGPAAGTTTEQAGALTATTTSFPTATPANGPAATADSPVTSNLVTQSFC